MSHTAGPWYTSGEAGDAFDISTELPDENGECEHVIATVWANRPSLPDAADDARLIAAAPELLDALRDTCAELEWLCECHRKCKEEPDDGAYSAIAKARTVLAKAERRDQ